MVEPIPGKGLSSPDGLKKVISRRTFLGLIVDAGLAYALTTCVPYIPVIPGAVDTATLPSTPMNTPAVKETAIPLSTPIIEKTPIPQFTPIPPESNSILPSTDTYPLFPEYDPALTDMSSEGLQKRFDKAVADKILTPIGKQDNLDKIDAQIRGVVYLQYRQEVGQRLFTDEKNQLEEMLSYAKDKKYDLIYSWNGEIGDKFQTIVTLTRTNEKGEKQIWWNGTISGALYLRPDSFDTYETTSGYWVTTAASPVIQWKDDNTPIVFSEKSGDTPVRWFNPLAKSLSESNYLGEWQGLMEATATPNTEATKQADFEAKKAEALKMVSIKLDRPEDFKALPVLDDVNDFDSGKVQETEHWLIDNVLPPANIKLPDSWGIGGNFQTGFLIMDWNHTSEPNVVTYRGVSAFFVMHDGKKMLRLGVEYGGKDQLIHFNFEDPKWWTDPTRIRTLIAAFNRTDVKMTSIAQYGTDNTNWLETQQGYTLFSDESDAESYSKKVTLVRSANGNQFAKDWVSNRQLPEGADKTVFGARFSLLVK